MNYDDCVSNIGTKSIDDLNGGLNGVDAMLKRLLCTKQRSELSEWTNFVNTDLTATTEDEFNALLDSESLVNVGSSYTEPYFDFT